MSKPRDIKHDSIHNGSQACSRMIKMHNVVINVKWSYQKVVIQIFMTLFHTVFVDKLIYLQRNTLTLCQPSLQLDNFHSIWGPNIEFTFFIFKKTFPTDKIWVSYTYIYGIPFQIYQIYYKWLFTCFSF